MNPVEMAFDALLEKNLEAMRENIGLALSQKAAQSLEERKAEVAETFFDLK